VTFALAVTPALAQSSAPLSQLSLEELGRISVTSASKVPEEIRRTPAAVRVLTRDDIRRAGVTSIPEALRLVPGVEVARIDSDKWSVGIRGFGSRLSKSVLVLIDGRSVYTPLFAGVYWEDHDTLLDDIDRIEVIPGPGGTVWGANAVNGVINIITRSAKDSHGVLATVQTGTIDQAGGAVRYGSGNGRGLDYRLYGKGFTRGAEFHSDNQPFDDWRMAQGGFRLDWDSGRRDTVTIQGDFYSGVAGQRTTLTSYAAPFFQAVQRNIDLSGANVLARWRRVFAGGSDLQVQAYYDQTHRLEAGFGEDRQTFDVDVIHHFNVARRHSVIWGVGANVSASDTIQTVPTLVFTPAQMTDRLYSAFAQDEIALIQNRLSLSLGSKLLNTSYTASELEPSARLLWTPTSRQSLWVAATRALRTPSAVEERLRLTSFFQLVPNAPTVAAFSRLTGDGQFASEKLDGYEAGYRHVLAVTLSADVAVFFNSYRDLFSTEIGRAVVETTPAPFHVALPIYLRNGLHGETTGFEVTPAWTPVPWWRLKGSYAYLHMNIRPNADSLDNGANLNGSSPHHQVVAQSAFNLPRRFEFDQTLRYVSALTAPATTVDAYSTADARLSWHASDALEFAIVGRNLLQPHHVEFSGNQGALVGIERNVSISATWHR
jgi:iron complex outermembrane receptor protein